MNTQLKVLLLFNAIMFMIAGVMEWQYYTAHEPVDPQTDYSNADLVSIHSRSKSPPVDLEELHRSFRKKIPQPVNTSLSTGLIPREVAGQTQLVRIPGDGSGRELSNAALVVFCYNRYPITSCISITICEARYEGICSRHDAMYTHIDATLGACCCIENS